LGLEEVYRIGGAQAIAAFAYGTSSIQRVDKVVGAGNIYVALAKAMVFGAVGIDGFYGPSEVVVVADENADPALAASELLAQAEHSPDAVAVLVSWSRKLVRAVREELARLTSGGLDALARLKSGGHGQGRAKRSKPTPSPRESLAGRAAFVETKDEQEAIEVVNELAPEHLALMVTEPAALLEQVRHAGCILMGESSPVAVSDYAAGPSHLLPTGGTARFSSGLSVMDFIKRSSVVSVSPAWLRRFGPVVETLARMESLPEHARSISLRLKKARS
jgi:histidinol dehydrogenase